MRGRKRKALAATGVLLSFGAVFLFSGVRSAAAPAADIGAEGAKQAAYACSGFTQDQVTFLEIKEDYEDGLKVYEVEFLAGSYQFEYDVDSSTGVVVKGEFKLYNAAVPPTTAAPAPVTPPVITTPEKPAQTAGIDRDKALQIALAHAGVGADQIRKSEVKYDYEHGNPVYEVDFKVNDMEYEYEIHAGNGTILSYDIDD